jgi:hypothetical protein
MIELRATVFFTIRAASPSLTESPRAMKHTAQVTPAAFKFIYIRKLSLTVPEKLLLKNYLGLVFALAHFIIDVVHMAQ